MNVNMATVAEEPLSKRSKIDLLEAENNNQKCSEDTRPVCQHGTRCFRRSMQHKLEFRHPENAGNGACHETVEICEESHEDLNNEKLLLCAAGVDCKETDLIHFAEYRHPLQETATFDGKESGEEVGSHERDECEVVDLDDGFLPCEATLQISDDYDEESDGECNDKNGLSASLISRDDTVLSRGPSILRSYSILTEEERKELIRRAFELKDMLMKDLSETQKVIERKNKELKKVHSRLEKASLKIEGEREALEKEDLVYFPLFAEREHKEGSAAQIHFRLAESQFYRLVDTKDKYRVTKVEYVVNPVLIGRYKKAQGTLRKGRGDTSSYPVLAFHGTKEENIHSICETGFRVPGESRFEHATDTGWYGRGVYFSEYPSYSMEYIKGSSRLLLCQVLPGNVYRCTKLIHGEPLQIGYDSHASPDEKELVIFNAHHILPSYVVHYGEAKGDFTYQAD